MTKNYYFKGTKNESTKLVVKYVQDWVVKYDYSKFVETQIQVNLNLKKLCPPFSDMTAKRYLARSGNCIRKHT